MAGMLVAGAERVGALLHRFLTEVIASAVTTACVAGATTLYLHYDNAPPTAPRAPVERADLANLLTPAADPGAVALVAAPRDVTRPVQPALPPARPRMDKVPREAGSRPKVAAKATEDLFAVPVEAAAAFEPDIAEATLDEPDGTQGKVEAPTSPDAQVIAAQNAPQPSFSLPPPQAATHPDRRLLGLPIPDALPSNEDVARGFRGIGQAVGSLIP